MSIASNVSVYTVGGGILPLSSILPTAGTGDPSSTGRGLSIGKLWINTQTKTAFILTDYQNGPDGITAEWKKLGSFGEAPIDFLSDDTGTQVSPDVNNVIQLSGTTNQVVTTSGTSKITWSLSPTLVAPGTLTVTGLLTASIGMTATTGNITATNGNIVLGTAGNKFVSTSVGSGTSAGANSFGTVTLSGGTATVLTTAVTASSLIMYSRQTTSGSTGDLYISAKVSGTSFTITSKSGSDSSTIAWFIIN